MRRKSQAPIPAGILVVIGGNENKGQRNSDQEKATSLFAPLDILKVFAELPKKKNAHIQIMTSASGEGNKSFADYKTVFAELGQHDVHHIHHERRADVLKEDPAKILAHTDALFIAGGNQLLLTSIYGGTPFLAALKEKYIFSRFIIGGTSAGAMALSTPMIYAGNEEVQQIAGQIKITTGLEFLRDVCIDTHFVHRSRFVRLAQVIASNPGCIGLGIEEDTAVIVRNGIQCDIVGSGSVIQIKGFAITRSNTKSFSDKSTFSVSNLVVDIMGKGDSFQIEQVNPVHR